MATTDLRETVFYLSTNYQDAIEILGKKIVNQYLQWIFTKDLRTAALTVDD